MAVNKWVLIGGGIFLAFVAVWLYAMAPTPSPSPSVTSTSPNVQTTGQAMLPTKTITINGQHLRVEVASTPQQQQDGLSGRSSLVKDTGMLFVFPQASNVGFWMKDMKFSLDIIFADAGGTIVSIAANLSPDTYPAVYYPAAPAQYVLEVPAGYAASHSIATGQKIVIQ